MPRKEVTEFIKPHLAIDADLDKVTYPVIVMPKIDGVRALNVNGKLLGRSLKPHKNVATSNHFGQEFLHGLDGELVLNDRVTSPSLCRDTTSAINTIEGEPAIYWYIFDYVPDQMVAQPYKERLELLTQKVTMLNCSSGPEFTKLRVVKHAIAYCREDVERFYESCIEEGYEGVIIRDPEGKHKNGRCTKNEANYLRIKPTADREALVIKVIEGETNLNEAKVNELGLTERSSHAENKVANGKVGALLCTNEFYPEPFKVSAGCLTDEQRVYYFNNPDKIEGQTIKYKFMDHGEKDKPRHARFHSFRAKSDM